MIYAVSIIPNIYYTQDQIFQFITKMNGVTDWWYYTDVYLIETTQTPLQMTTSIRTVFPGLIHFVVKVDLSVTAGVLPKEAWDWINKKSPSLMNLLKLNPAPSASYISPFKLKPLKASASASESPTRTNFSIEDLRRAIDRINKNKK